MKVLEFINLLKKVTNSTNVTNFNSKIVFDVEDKTYSIAGSRIVFNGTGDIHIMLEEVKE